jgi:hypothetical protein
MGFEFLSRRVGNRFADGQGELGVESVMAGKHGMGLVKPAYGDNVHFGQRAGVFFHKDRVLVQEGPDRLFDTVKMTFGANFEANDEFLVTFCGDGSVEHGVEEGLVFREVFGIDIFILTCVEQNTSILKDKLGDELLEDGGSVGRLVF